MATEKLTQIQVNKSKVGLLGDGGGLWLKTTEAGTRSWILRFRVNNKEHWMGLGGYPEVGLREARDLAKQARIKVRSGINPIEDRASQRADVQATLKKALTFEECASKYIDTHRSAWKNAKHADQWVNTIATYAHPVIGAMNIKDVELDHILQILRPIWATKTETASRVRGRLEAILDWSTVHKLREGENPARWRGHLDKVLPAPEKVSRAKHHAALHYWSLNAFMTELHERRGIAARALEFLILTAARSGEVRESTWDEIDFGSMCWTIPAERMKAGREHKVPLSIPAAALLEELYDQRIADNQLIFPGTKPKRPMSDMSLSAVLRRMDYLDITVHGFRSTFRDWGGEISSFPREVIEHALAHQLKDKTEAAYQRGSLFDKRRQLMTEWANFCGKPPEIPPHQAPNNLNQL